MRISRKIQLKAGVRSPSARAARIGGSGLAAGSSRGIALIVVMIAIFVLSLLAGAFAYSMKVETKLAMTARHEGQLEWLGRSGVEYARWILAQQMMIPNEPYDSLNQIWAGGPGSLAESNSPLTGVSLQDVRVGDGKFSIKITDLDRKVNINSADEELLHHALTVMGVDASEIPTISDSILDWIDPDDVPHVNGAESDYYQTLDPPYYAKDGPVDDLSELLLIKGITPEMYWGPGSTNHPPGTVQTVHQLTSPLDEPSYTAGLVDIFTPISSGKININTASETTLQMIPGVDENIAAQIIRIRSGPDGQDGTDDDTPFRSVGELATVGFNNAAAGELNRYCTVRSSAFEVEVTAEIGGTSKTFHAILGRNNPRDIQVLSFH